jgi:CTP synthase (UTP-ammonia lyase)
MGLRDAAHAEYGGRLGAPVVSALSCSLVGRQIAVDLQAGCMLARLHGTTRVVENTTCNYGLNPDYQYIASEKGMMVCGTDETGEVRAIERPDHPYFIGTLYQPQLQEQQPHPIFTGLISAALA